MKENQIIFAVSPEGMGDGIPFLMIGIPAEAWEYMKDGKTNTIDLTKAGVPLRLIMYGASDHAAALKMIEGHLANQGAAYLDARRTDFAVKSKEK